MPCQLTWNKSSINQACSGPYWENNGPQSCQDLGLIFLDSMALAYKVYKILHINYLPFLHFTKKTLLIRRKALLINRTESSSQTYSCNLNLRELNRIQLRHPTLSYNGQCTEKLTQIQLFTENFLNVLLSCHWESLHKKIKIYSVMLRPDYAKLSVMQ